MPDLSHPRGCARQDAGFTMIVTVLVLLVLMLLSVGAYTAVNGDVHAAAYSNDQKQAYSAAEAGLNWYLAQLTQDPSYWTHCTAVPQVPNGSGGFQTAPVNNPYNPPPYGTDGTDTRVWRTVDDPGAGPSPTSTARYEIELLPAPGKSACDPLNAATSMIDPSTGAFRLRITGQARPGGAKRSIIATLRRRGFLDFLYFTDLETLDPPLTKVPWALGGSQGGDPVAWANANCAGRYAWGSNSRDPACTRIQFGSADSVNGPFHSNDQIYTCGNPTFGRVSGGKPAGDSLELGAPSPGYTTCGSGAPVWNGTLQTSAQLLPIPPSNSAQAATVTPGYQFSGRTWIRFNSDGTMTVTNATMGLTDASLPQPTNGEIYVANSASGCPTPYDPLNPYGAAQSCGDAYVQGTYTKSMTVGSANDVVITGNIAASGDVILGLVGNQYVRVYHKVNPQPVAISNGQCTSTNVSNDPNWDHQEPGTLSNLTITAAILSVKHSFLVDNWECGASPGTLTVNGAIAQEFRGPVGTGNGGGVSTGYAKSYGYDDRLKFRSPPFFLDPTQSAWRVVRAVEQSPAV